MNKTTLALSLFLFTPFVASAQSVQTILPNLVSFLNSTIVPFLLGIAFLFFVINAIRFFVIGGSNEQDRDKAKSLAIYSMAAFVFIIIFWGLINILSSSIGLDKGTQPKSDYEAEFGA